MNNLKRLALRITRKVVTPLLPRRSRLAFRYWYEMSCGSPENELKYLDRIAGDGRLAAIDVGANAGLFSYKLSKRFEKVYAFEINESLTGDLAAYNPGNIKIIHEGLSSREGSATLYIPVLNGLPLTGWASLRPNNCPDTQDHVEKPVHIAPLDTFEISPVSFLKIDVEGHEREVLEGARRTLERNRPIVLIEIKRQNLDDVTAFFEALNYRRKKLDDLIRIEGSEENYIFVPDPRSGPGPDVTPSQGEIAHASREAAGRSGPSGPGA